jgi:hypothetical protein
MTDPTIHQLAAITRSRPSPTPLVCPSCKGDRFAGLYECLGCGKRFERLAELEAR